MTTCPSALIVVALVFGATVTSSLVVDLLVGSLRATPARGWRRKLVRVAVTLAALVTLSGIIAARTAGSNAFAGLETPSARWAAAHAMAAGMWLGVLLPLALVARGGASAEHQTSSALERSVGHGGRIALVLFTIMAVTGVAASRSLDGWPSLVGTRYGQLLLLQAALFAAACGLLIITLARLAAAPDGADRGLLARPLARFLAIDAALASSLVIVAVMLTLLARAGEPTVWPFSFRLAPDVMLRFPSVREQVIGGSVITAGGLLAAFGAYRTKPWRPLLLALAALLLVMGLSKTLAPMTIDAYPTTYARPAVAGTGDSIRRGRALFAAHCAPCHGASGRGDGPAGAGLLQRPADLTASHTADHTPGDLYWWITHGLGLAMPAFGDRLSIRERWDLVNFVRTLATGRGPLAASPTSARGERGDLCLLRHGTRPILGCDAGFPRLTAQRS